MLPAVEGLLESDPEPSVRLVALEAVAQFTPNLGLALRRRLRRDPDPEVRARAVQRLAEGTALGVTDFLLERLGEFQTFSFREEEDLDQGEATVVAALVRALKLLGVPEERIAHACRARLPASSGEEGGGGCAASRRRVSQSCGPMIRRGAWRRCAS